MNNLVVLKRANCKNPLVNNLQNPSHYKRSILHFFNPCIMQREMV